MPESLSAWDEIKRNSWWSIAELEHRSTEHRTHRQSASRLKWPQVTYIKNKMFKARFQNVYSYVKKLKMEIISSSSKFNIVIGTLTTWPSIDYTGPRRTGRSNVLILAWKVHRMYGKSHTLATVPFNIWYFFSYITTFTSKFDHFQQRKFNHANLQFSIFCIF